MTREHRDRAGCSKCGASWSRLQQLQQQLAGRQCSLSSMPARVGSSRMGSTAGLAGNPRGRCGPLLPLFEEGIPHRFISTVASTKTKRQASTDPATAQGAGRSAGRQAQWLSEQAQWRSQQISRAGQAMLVDAGGSMRRQPPCVAAHPHVPHRQAAGGAHPGCAPFHTAGSGQRCRPTT